VNQQQQLQKARMSIETALAQRQPRIDAEVVELERLSTKIASLDAQRTDLFDRRREMFGEQSVDEVRMSASTALSEAETARDVSRDAATSAERVLTQQQVVQGGLNERLTTSRSRLADQERGFLTDLGSIGFEDEASFLNARLPTEEREQLAQRARALREEQVRLDGLMSEKQRALSEEQATAPTTEGLETLKDQREELDQVLTTLNQRLGAVEEQLVEAARARQTQAKALEERDKLRADKQLWDDLHDLIGSHDGKKFRNYVQALTFDAVIGHANQQLQHMSDRYLLIRDPAEPLELSVVDAYQAGEIRSAKNLSGGESFIVSMALALGLSRMASRTVRVDSLFLDEGFGTLDEDALDTALATLAALRQEGKLIGVISHVPALKERISTRISVAPRPGGRSEVSGPGVTRS
jgi:exonuclease SbcC